MKLRAFFLTLAAVVCMAAASDPSERLQDPAQEARARSLFKEVRCLICQSESIDDSESLFAQTARKVIREQVEQGASDTQVKRFLIDRYGEYILLKPPFNPANLALWLGPFVLVAVGGAGMFMLLRRREAPAPLTAEEEARVAKLMDQG
ncbi:MAG: cytochrome c-type biogenesis protein CcmH [Caulobacterales bacterium 68-7]|nr:cytochrome c-type biogenesis protein CcmH [Caulobacterales bacterium]OJU11644.1 MAG: cytochrome c-type biogenesis protein CcmH [Caulobacterales bacterium 68-7]